MRDRLSTAIGFGFLTVILMAGAAQSLAGTNTVDSGDIVDRTIGVKDVKVGAFGGQTILDNSMTTNDVNESTLVPTCKSGLTRAGDVCYTPVREADDLIDAIADCTDERLRLPTLTEGTLIAKHIGAPTVDDLRQLWTDSIYLGNQQSDPQWFAVYTWKGIWDAVPTSTNKEYSCVTTVGARP